MGGSVPEGLLFSIKADVEKAVAGLRGFDNAVNNTKKKTANVFGEVSNQYKAMVQSSRLLGENADLTSKKMAFLGDAIKKGMASGDMSKKNIETLMSMRETVKQNATGFEKLKMGVTKLGESFGVSGLGGSLVAAGLAMGALALAAKAFVAVAKTGLDFNMMIEKNTVAIRVMTGSIEETIKLTGQMQKLVQETPATMQEAFGGAKQLLAYGFGTENLVDNMKMLSTVSGAVGVSLGDLTYVYGTLRSQGRAYTRDLMQFAMRGIPIYEELGRVLGATGAEVKKMAENGEVGFAEVEKAFKNMTGEGGRFAGMLEAQMGTLSGQLNILGKNSQILAGVLTEGLAEGFKNVLKPLNAVLGGLVKLSTHNKNLGILNKALVDTGANWQGLSVNSFGDMELEARRLLPALDAQYEKLKANKDISLEQLQIYKDQIDTVRGIADIKSPPMVGSISAIMQKRGLGSANIPDTAKKQAMEKIGTDMAFALKEGNGDILKTTQAVQNIFKLGWKDSLDAVADYMVISKDQYEDVLAKEKASSKTFFMQFQQMMKQPFGDRDITGATEGFGQAMATFGKDFEDTQRLIAKGVFGPEDSKEAISAFDNALSTMQEKYLGAIELMNQNPMFTAVDAGGTPYNKEAFKFLQLFIGEYKRLDTLKKGGKDSGKKETDKFWEEYEAVRATLDLQKESYDIRMQMVYANKFIAEGQTAESAQIDAVLNKYQAMREEAFKITNATDKQNRLQAIQLMQEKAIADIKRASYEKSAGIAAAYGDMSKSYANQIALAKAEYGYKLMVADLTINAADRALAIKQAEYDLEKKLTALGVERYNKLLNGSEAYWDKLKQQMADQQGEGDVGGMMATGAQLGAQGTQVGSLMAGADPVTMIIMEFVKLFASLENFGKLLNPIALILESLKPALDLADKALRPVVMLYEQEGALLGELLGPVLESVFKIFGDLARILIPIIQALKPVFRIIGEIIGFLVDLVGGVISVLAGMVGTSADEVALKEEQIKKMKEMYDKELKSLQDLYNVGAISGKEYEARLAAMQAAQGDTGSPYAPDNELVKAVLELLDITKTWLYPIFQLQASLLAGFFNGIIGVIAGLTGFVGGFANIIAGIFSGNGDLVLKGLKMMLLGVAGILAGIIDALVINPINAILSGLKNLDLGPLGKPLSWISLISTLTSMVTAAMNSLAVGTPMVPKDMMANIHKGEMIVPSNFAESLRSGELSLSGGKGYNNSAPNITVYVAGNVTTERDLVKTIYAETRKMGRQGYL